MTTRAIKIGKRHRIRVAVEWREWLIGFGKEAPAYGGSWSAHLLCLVVVGWKTGEAITSGL